MTVKTEFSPHELIEILANYQLGALEDFKPISSGTVQTNFLLQTTHGTFVFRYYENRSMGSVLFESELMCYLQDKKYPCPALLKNKSGEAVGIYNEKPYSIFEFAEGQHLENPDEFQQKQLIREVAHLQIITRDYKPRHTDDRLNYDVDHCRALAQVTATRIGTLNAQAKLAWFEYELAQLQLPASLPKGICHGDFHFSNILFKDGKFNALIDFDDANYTFLAYDLVNLMNPFITTFEWHSWFNFKPDAHILDFSAARKTVVEYNRYRPLDENEKKYLFDVYKLSILFDCIWYFERGDVKDFYEKRKIAALNLAGRDAFYTEIFGHSS
ncbi:hypothetical protein KDA_72500 [Dictyobacter alpinus]|uniref:Aminoglycoside phosphotransferase domain-containing protein n=1 Tax=Dictyobacter alpinus TaxID=2014873 RepID=A0A402BKB2_9CHLR|nr:homoserine kinase [Dictyobacter alpinus]GCE31766.1 hypothetical protein KDA_72500 [Dictyobacter alpinus]